MNRVGPAGEDDHLGTVAGDGFQRGSAGDAEREDVDRADSASYEVCVLGTVV
uniref:GMP synthase n=1 Tax=Rhizophora mucronata TaxID=61149 RepID=A0A2P2PXT3_RHIMU